MNRKTTVGDGSVLEWRKSSYSSNSSDADCVEVAAALGVVHVRDSKDAGGPRFAVAPAAWSGFVTFASGADS